MSLILRSVSLFNFKNYENVRLAFSGSVNCLVGENGAGKTNLLDAIYYLCMCKSYFNPFDSENILHGREVFKIEGEFELNDAREIISCKVTEGTRKEFLRNQQPYPKLSHHLGLLPIVVVAPDDVALITGGSEERRRFMDSMIAQTEREYIDNLLGYNKVLSQRNATLRQFAERNFFDARLLAEWDNRLIDFGEKIFAKRKAMMDDFFPLFQKYYSLVSGEKERADGKYRSDLEEHGFRELLKKSLEKDKVLERTNAGIHKDDIVFHINDYPVKRFGSQGQMKSFLIALKLAEFELIKRVKQVTPLLLLDDIFDKLDGSRVSHLIDLIAEEGFGQIFITDTDRERVEGILKEKGMAYKMFGVISGKFE